jgi:hypothetical protein
MTAFPMPVFLNEVKNPCSRQHATGGFFTSFRVTNAVFIRKGGEAVEAGVLVAIQLNRFVAALFAMTGRRVHPHPHEIPQRWFWLLIQKYSKK